MNIKIIGIEDLSQEQRGELFQILEKEFILSYDDHIDVGKVVENDEMIITALNYDIIEVKIKEMT